MPGGWGAVRRRSRSPSRSRSGAPTRRWTSGRPTTSSPAPAPSTRCGPTATPSSATGSCPGGCGPAPLMLAPIGVQKVVHEDGELATARAAAEVGVPMIASTNSHFTLEEIAEAGGEAPRWFQLYWPNDRRLAESFVSRAELAGYKAIVLTVDTFVPGWKSRDPQQAWLPFLNGMGVANYFQDPIFRAGLDKSPEEDQGAATGHFLGVQALPWLRELTSLPILVKGIQHVDAAL